ncbi:MAG: hypothetical protein K0R18_214 [Bacillales bacterium]|jgi:hypothetical protein|nr:hypothetical protein [Bacillales bacterium]
MDKMLQRYSSDIKHIEMWHNLTRFKFKKIHIFGHEIRVPIKYADEFEEKISALEVMMEMTNASYSIRSNHTMIEIALLDEYGMIDVALDLEFYFGFMVITNKKFKKGSRLKRVSFKKLHMIVNNNGAMQAEWIHSISESDKFHLIVDKAIEYFRGSK